MLRTRLTWTALILLLLPRTPDAWDLYAHHVARMRETTHGLPSSIWSALGAPESTAVAGHSFVIATSRTSSWHISMDHVMVSPQGLQAKIAASFRIQTSTRTLPRCLTFIRTRVSWPLLHLCTAASRSSTTMVLLKIEKHCTNTVQQMKKA